MYIFNFKNIYLLGVSLPHTYGGQRTFEELFLFFPRVGPENGENGAQGPLLTWATWSSIQSYQPLQASWLAGSGSNDPGDSGVQPEVRPTEMDSSSTSNKPVHVKTFSTKKKKKIYAFWN